MADADNTGTPASNSAGGSSSQQPTQNQKDLENLKLLIQLINTRGDGR
jgi:hypothetical protein